VRIDDPINSAILAISEDKLQGFQIDPIGEISKQSGIDVDTVIERIVAMLRAGTIRRVRQTMLSTNLARGALVAWKIPEDRLSTGFDYLFQDDPFSGHVVIRSTDNATAGSKYRLWSTLKVPDGFSMEKHCQFLASKIGAESFRIMPAKKLFALGVGHVRRKTLEPGAKSDSPAEVTDTDYVQLSDREWDVLMELKREFAPEEIRRDLWKPRAEARGIPIDEFLSIAKELNARGVVGRFSTFLEHYKPLTTGERVTKFNALFHWAVPKGREIEAGREVGRFEIMTHAYWREGGDEFANVNIMGVAHGTDKQLVLAHKKAIDEHLASVGIPVSYTNVFWGGRSEIKPSEIAPVAYREWCKKNGIDAAEMRE
jgi:DNA-binding Lrp family transcriptional regulator